MGCLGSVQNAPYIVSMRAFCTFHCQHARVLGTLEWKSTPYCSACGDFRTETLVDIHGASAAMWHTYEGFSLDRVSFPLSDTEQSEVVDGLEW